MIDDFKQTSERVSRHFKEKAKAEKQGRNLSDVVRELLEAWVKGEFHNLLHYSSSHSQ
jgi:hypothetical protein